MNSDKNKENQSKALKIVNVFSRNQLIFGLPSNVFGMGAAITPIIFFLLSKTMAILFAIIFFRVMFAIHEEDPKGFEVWRSLLYRQTKGWSAGAMGTSKIIVLNNR